MSKPMSNSLSQQYLEPLLAGNRAACRSVIDAAVAKGIPAYDLLTKLVWPTMELVQTLYREDRITQATVNLATRLNRTLCDQLAGSLPKAEANGKKVTIFCGNDEPEELGGQLCSDLFESAGWEVKFVGGGVPNDEILKMIGDQRPDVMVMYGTQPQAVPAVRKLIDYLREVNSCPEMQIMCCGGIYKRAEGLAEEIGADLFAPDAASAVKVAEANPEHRASYDQQTVGRSRRVRKAAAEKRAAAAERVEMDADAA
ncbi:MAG TPA: B12-binding domain-containing protein [Tepidisphaeraceae bacterium]|nr:B12-binding domain-containing protein [Tepidisphaeraceae bacterium]